MPITWTITIGSQPAISLAQAGIANVVRRLSSQAADSAELIFLDGSATRPLTFADGQAVRIFRDGVCWFAGKIDSPTRDERSLSADVRNVWADLEELQFTRSARYVADSAITTGTDVLDDYPTTNVVSTVVLLNRNDAGEKVLTSAMIQELIAFAVAKGYPLQAGTIETGIQIPTLELRDATVAAAILDCLRYTPDLTPWWDYSFSPPKLNITKRRGKTALALDTQTTVFEPGMRFTALPHLLVSGVTINFLRTHDRPSFQFLTLTQQTAGVLTSGRQIARTFELYGSRWANIGNPAVLTKINDAEAVPSGIAARVLESLSDLHYEGSATIVADECPAGSYLGRKLNVANFTPEAATMNADIRRQTDDIMGGRTTIDVGPPPVLGAGQFVELLRAGRPADLTPVDRQNDGAIRAQGNVLPATSPTLVQFSPRQPDVILRSYNWTGYFSNGQGGGFYSAPGILTVLNPDGSLAGTFSSGSMVVGAVVDYLGIKVGRQADFEMGALAICNGGYYASKCTTGIVPLVFPLNRTTQMYGQNYGTSPGQLPNPTSVTKTLDG